MGDKKDVFAGRKSKAKLTADAGYHGKANLEMLAQEKIDAYVADPQLRKRDERFAGVDKYKQRHRKERRKLNNNAMKFGVSDQGRAIYARRIGTIEPVFAHIRTTLRLDRFTLRGKEKVNAQWLLYSILHNLKKIYRYGPLYNTS